MPDTPPLSRLSLPLVLAALCLAFAPLRAQITTIVDAGSPQGPVRYPAQDTPDTATDATTVHLSAIVVSSLDGKPVPRVLVTTPDRRLAVMTDYQGHFAFDVRHATPPGTQSGSPRSVQIFGDFGGFGSIGGFMGMPLQFQLRKPGYVTANPVLRLPTGDAAGQPLQLKIVPAGLITGHIDPDNGDPTTGITVQLRHKMVQNGIATWNSTAGGAQVDSHGEFRFPDLEPGDYKLMASARVERTPALNQARTPPPDSIPGLAASFYPNVDSLDAAAILHIAPGQTLAVNLAPPPATFYRVTIPIAGGDAIQGANIMLQPESFGLFLNYNNRDRAIEGYLPPGSYTADIITYAPNPEHHAPSPGDSSAPPIRFAATRPQTSSAMVHLNVARAPVQTAPVAPVPGFEIPVVVHREFSATQNTSRVPSGPTESPQRPSVFVNLQPINPMMGGGAALTPGIPGDPDDDLKIRNVTEGVYRVYMGSAVGGYVAAASSGTTDLLRDPLTVGASGSPFPIEVTLRDDAASVTGTILPGSQTDAATQTDTASAPSYLTGTVFVMGIPLDRPQSDPMFSAAMPSQNSSQPAQFQLGMIPPGHYLFLASHQQIYQELEYRNPEVLRTLMAKGAAVTISAGEKATVQVPLLPEDGN